MDGTHAGAEFEQNLFNGRPSISQNRPFDVVFEPGRGHFDWTSTPPLFGVDTFSAIGELIDPRTEETRAVHARTAILHDHFARLSQGLFGR